MISRTRYISLCFIVLSLCITFISYSPGQAEAAAGCSGTASITFIGFEFFGMVHLQIRHTYPSRVSLSDFQINWIQRLPGVLTLHQVAAWNPPNQPRSVIVWTSGSVIEDATPRTLSRSEGTWVQSVMLPPARKGKPSINDLYLDFDGVTGLLSDVGIAPSDFNGTNFTVTPFCLRTLTKSITVSLNTAAVAWRSTLITEF